MVIYHPAETIREIENLLRYEFNDKILLDMSLQAAGFTSAPEGHKRLALIGEPVMKLELYLDVFGRKLSTGNRCRL